MTKEVYIYVPSGEITCYKVGEELGGIGEIQGIEIDNEDGLAKVYININNLEGKLIRGWMMIVGLPYTIVTDA